jgi:hypothetical protein
VRPETTGNYPTDPTADPHKKQTFTNIKKLKDGLL